MGGPSDGMVWNPVESPLYMELMDSLRHVGTYFACSSRWQLDPRNKGKRATEGGGLKKQGS